MLDVTDIGPHRVSRSCISNPELQSGLMQGEVADVLYSDLPWGGGNVKYWHTLRKKQTGNADTEPLTLEQLNEELVRFIRLSVQGPIYLETGIKWVEQTRKVMLDAGCPEVVFHESRYDSDGKPCAFLTGRNDGGDYGELYDPSDIDTRFSKLSQCAVAAVAKKGGIVVDPCCGMGWTARAAFYAGMRFFGNEFNEHRAAQTIKWLQKRV